ncbi:MAG: hypothetical protein ACK4WC_08980 [Rubrimonas sp.]
MRFDVRHNIAEVERGLSNFAREQVPFAVSVAINAVAQQVAEEQDRQLRRALDRPTPFTLRGVGVSRSSKRRLVAAVFVKDRQAAYLRFQEAGGVRQPAKRAIPVPAKLRRNRFGNMPRGAVANALAASNTFSGTPKGGGQPGVYRRLGATADRKGGFKLERVLTWADQARYRPRLGFIKTARRVAANRIAPEFETALAKAIATARR